MIAAERPRSTRGSADRTRGTSTSRSLLVSTILPALGAAVFLLSRNAAAEESAGPIPSAADFDRLVEDLRLDAQPWATIPWQVSVTEARELAGRTRKPIFLVVNTGNCLGFV
jgi:hypothetical protein